MNITELAIKHKTDKWGSHFYTKHYENHFSFFKDKKVTLIEIGIGGYGNPYKGGESLRVWSEWFSHPDSRIIGIDINEKKMMFDDPRVKIYQGSQIDKEFLMEVHQRHGDFDIVIDDGSHLPEHVIETFKILYPKTKDGGIYVIEDTQTSYWDGPWGHQSVYNIDNPTYSYFKKVIDWINYAEIPINKEPNYFELHTVGVHFYHNIIFIDKNLNDEKSNVIPSRLQKKADVFKKSIISIDSFVGYANLGLMAHVGGIGDIHNLRQSSIMTDSLHCIQGFTITCNDDSLKGCLEYRACFDSKDWTDWATCNNYVGTRGKNKNLCGLTVRLKEDFKEVYKLLIIGAFKNEDGLVLVDEGIDCVSKQEKSPLIGIQIILQFKSN
jgi:demethylmacrocin O-methyltransferase